MPIKFIIHHYFERGKTATTHKEVEYDIVLREYDIHEDSFFKRTEYGYVSGRIYDCMGALRIHVFDTANGVEVSGQYVNCPDTLKELLFIEDVVTQDGEIKVVSFFTPLKDGEWIFENKRKNLVEKVIYRKGWRKSW